MIFRQGPAGTAFTAAVMAWLVFEFVMRARQRRQAGRPACADPTFLVLIACLAAAVAAAEMLGRDGRLPWPGGLAWPAVAGIALIIAGIGLRACSLARQLTRALGAGYEHFAAARKRLVPGVW